MKLLVVFCLVAFVAVNAQLTTTFLIDDFSNGVGQQEVEVALNSDLSENETPIVATSSETFPGCSGLLACSRDMEMRVFSGLQGREFTSQLLVSGLDEFPAEWVISNPKTSTSIATLEYDGPDGNFDGDSNGNGGLGGVDVTTGGSGVALRLSAVTDLATTYDVFFIDMDGDSCEYDLDVPVTDNDYTLEETVVDVNLSTRSDDCDLTNIGYIKVTLSSDDAVDAIVRTLSIVGTDPSNTPTPSPNPSPSRNPSASPSPSTVPDQFTWYTFDDDDNGRSPCGDEPERVTYFIDDRNIIYYYFFGNEVVTESSSSDASILGAGLAMLAAVFII